MVQHDKSTENLDRAIKNIEKNLSRIYGSSF